MAGRDGELHGRQKFRDTVGEGGRPPGDFFEVALFRNKL